MLNGLSGVARPSELSFQQKSSRAPAMRPFCKMHSLGNDFVVIENADGTTGIRARLGFSKEEVKDIESFIRNNTTDIEPMQTLQSS